MGRLVDIDAVIKAVDRHTKDESEVVLDNDITCILEEVPTAYDVEKVVAELEKEDVKALEKYRESFELYIEEFWRGRMTALQNAIDIVEAGGVE